VILRPPGVAEQLLARALRASPYRDDILGDLYESYAAVAAAHSIPYARCWYWAHAIRLAARTILRAQPVSSVQPAKEHRMDRLLMDLRFAIRSLVKQPTTTIAIVVTLALGVGANTAVFGVIDALLLRPFTMRNVDRIVMPVSTSPHWSGRRETVSAADFLDWRTSLRGAAIDHLAGMNWWDANLVGRDQPERVLGFFVSPEFFAALDAHAAIGRTFLPQEEITANATRVVLSDGLWRRRFGADPSIVGKSTLIDGAQWLVVGVMPPTFDFPMRAELWGVLSLDEKSARNRSNHYLTVIGRLGDDRTLDEARGELRALSQRLAREHPETNSQLGAEVYTVSRGMADVGVPAVLALWQAAGLFVLLIACANIANLLLARAAEREREIAIRLALGSSRGRVVRGSLLESAMLVVASTPLALAVAWASLRLMRASMPARIVRYIAGWDQMGLDFRTIAVTLTCAAVAALIFGTVPAVQLARGVVSDALKADGRTGAGPGRQRARRVLVVAEIALALPLLVAAMLSISTVTRFLTSWQGYDPNNVLTMRLVLPELRYPDADSRERFTVAALDRLRTMPGAVAVAAGNVLPAIDSNASRAIELPGQPPVDPSKAPRVDYRVVSEQYFEVLRTPLVSGRAFTTADRKGSEAVAIVSEAMARKFWPSGGALDQQIRIANGPWMRVVGICGDIVHDWFDVGTTGSRVPTLYRPIAQAPADTFALAIRTTGDPLSLVNDTRIALAKVDATQPIFDVMTLRQVLNEKTISLRYIATVMGVFAGLAVLLAVLGLYAVMTFLVARRVREIGVRIALGATSHDVVRLTLGQAARLTAVGIAVGFVMAVALGRLMEAGLLGIVSSDIRISAALAAGLGATALFSSYLPARRAASVDPIVALRAE